MNHASATGNNVMSSTKDGLTRLSKVLPPLVRYWRLHACVRTRVQPDACTEGVRAFILEDPQTGL